MTDLDSLRKAAHDYPGDTPEERWARLTEARLLEAGEPPFSQWWWALMVAFWNSGKTALVVGKANRAGGTTHIVRMAATPESVFRERKPVADSELVWPNASATVKLANDSIRMFASTLRALGLREVKTRSKDEIKRVDSGSYFLREGSNAVAGSIEFLDGSGNRVEYRSQPASKAGLSGFTGMGFTADEVELWKGEAERPSEVLELGLSRLKGQAGTRAYAISRLFAEGGPLHTIAQLGDNEGQMVARLGATGARDDEIARLALRDHLKALATGGDRHARIYSEDPRLTEEADPASIVIPAWSALPVGKPGEYGPDAAIRECWRLASTGWGLEPGEVPLEGLFRVYGGRPTGHEGARYFDTRFLREARERRA